MKGWTHFLFVLLIPAVPVVQMRVDDALGPFGAQPEVLYVWSGEQIRRTFPGLETLMADVYWLRTVQYFGGQRAFASEKRFELLRPLIDITTSLDPRLELAYRYGAIFLSEPWPIGAGKPKDGIEVLEKGVKTLPQSWRLRWDLGTFWYFFLRDYDRAARVLLEASKVPGTPYWFESMAADLLAHKGDREISRAIWKRQYEQGAEGAMRENAVYHLEYLDALDTIDILKAQVRRFREQNGAWPRSLADLVRAGMIPKDPVDPGGVAFAYNPETGDITFPRNSKFWRAANAYK